MPRKAKYLIEAAERMARTVALPTPQKLPLPPTKPKWGDPNHPDFGDVGVSRYSPLEKGVQNVEFIDSGISNLGGLAVAGTKAIPLITKFAPAAAKMAPAFAVTSAVASKLAPIQVALWGADGVRAVADPEYRQKTLEANDNLYDDPNKSTAHKSVETFLNTMARPVSTTGAMLRSYRGSTSRIQDAEEEIGRSDVKLRKLKVAKEDKRHQKGVEDVRSYIQQSSRESGIRRKFAEPVAPPREDYTGGRERVFPTKHPMNGNSNVKMAGVNMDGMERVIPTMVGGKQLSVKEAAALARSNGLDNYPSFRTVDEANTFAEENHGNIGEDGFLKRPPAAAMKGLRHQRRNLIKK